MVSYPSALVLDPIVNSGEISGNLQQSIKNIGETMMHAALNSAGSDSGVNKKQLGERLDFSDYDHELSIKKTIMFDEDNILYSVPQNLGNFDSRNAMVYPDSFGFNARPSDNAFVEDERKEKQFNEDHKNDSEQYESEIKILRQIDERLYLSRLDVFENAFKVPSGLFKKINKYRTIKKDAVLETDNGSLLTDSNENLDAPTDTAGKVQQDQKNNVGDKNKNATQKRSDDINYLNYTIEAASTSLFSPFYAIRASGISRGTPKMYTDIKENTAANDVFGLDKAKARYTAKIDPDTVNLAKQKKPNKKDYATKDKYNDAVDKWKKAKETVKQGYEYKELKVNENHIAQTLIQGTNITAVRGFTLEETDQKHKDIVASGKVYDDWNKQFEKDTGTGSTKNYHHKAGETKQNEVKDIVGKDNWVDPTKSDTMSAYGPINVNFNNAGNYTDCTIKKLIELSGFRYNTTPNNNKNLLQEKGLGRGTYRYIDFMYCRDVGKISNNHLITLRRFSHPIGDNIYSKQKDHAGNEKLEINDRGHLVTWFGNEENKLEDICKYSMNSTFRQMNSKIQDVQVNNQEGSSMGSSLLNLFSGSYANMVRAGTAGSENCILGSLTAGSKWFDNKGTYESPQFHRDANKVWEPKNTIQETHYYEGKIQFAHEFTLVFAYEMKHYDGINGKTAFLDLLGNILRTCHNNGRFWGGAIRVHGKGFTPGWHKMNKLLNALEKGANNIIDQIFGCTSWAELGDWCMNMLNQAMDMIQGAYEKAKELLTTPEGQAKLRAWGAKMAHNVVKMGIGMMKNKLGRPAAYATDSLLNGGNTGMWHVTIGNPRNPIMVMGNLIMVNAEVQHYGALGLDDFPTKLKVTCTMKHARPRDITDISKMYTLGQGGLALKMSEKKIMKYFNLSDQDTVADLGFAEEIQYYQGMGDTSNNEVTQRILVDREMVDAIWSNT